MVNLPATKSRAQRFHNFTWCFQIHPTILNWISAFAFKVHGVENKKINYFHLISPTAFEVGI